MIETKREMDSTIIEERPKKYIEQYLTKKEAKGKWIEYWVVCRGNFLLFYTHRCDPSELRESFRGSIELTFSSKCIIGKRKKYSFPFFLSTSKARYYFKCQTLLLRHQWIHAISLSASGSPPQAPPNTLPPPSTSYDSSSSQSDDDTLSDDASKIAITELMGDTSLTIADCPQEDTDFPSNVIVVRARSPDSKEVTNFLSGERAPDPSNFQVTNFLNSRDAEMTKTPRIGIDNHSFEEEDNNTRSDSRNSGTCTPIASPSPTFSLMSPTMSRSDSPARVIRSAGSIRGLSSQLRSSANNGTYLSVKTSESNLSLNSNRFSRYLVSSAPDLKFFTSSQA